jgi:hypothetical protein
LPALLLAGFFGVGGLIAAFFAGAFFTAGFFAAEIFAAVFLAGAFLITGLFTAEALVMEVLAGAFFVGLFPVAFFCGFWLLFFHNKTIV